MAQQLKSKSALLVMAKRPLPGRTKTRLNPPFSAVEAADLYESFLRDALDLARAVPDVRPMIAFAPPEAEAYFRNLAPHFDLIAQTGATLGERLNAVLTYCLQAGFMQVAAINSDSPTLPAAYVAQAFDCLDDTATDIVLGPCEDGGYYLIGWKRPHPRLVREVQMSTPYVLQDTLALAVAENLRVALLPTWYDVDDADDLSRVQTDLALAGRHTRRFLSAMSLPEQL